LKKENLPLSLDVLLIENSLIDGDITAWSTVMGR